MTKKIKVVIRDDIHYFDGSYEVIIDDDKLIIRHPDTKMHIGVFKYWTYWKMIES